MRIDLSSTKGRRELTGDAEAIVAAAWRFLWTYSPACGVDLTAPDGRAVANCERLADIDQAAPVQVQ